MGVVRNFKSGLCLTVATADDNSYLKGAWSGAR